MTMTGMPPNEELFKAWFPHKGGTNVAFLDGYVRLVGVQEPLWADFARRNGALKSAMKRPTGSIA